MSAPGIEEPSLDGKHMIVLQRSDRSAHLAVLVSRKVTSRKTICGKGLPPSSTPLDARTKKGWSFVPPERVGDFECCATCWKGVEPDGGNGDD